MHSIHVQTFSICNLQNVTRTRQGGVDTLAARDTNSNGIGFEIVFKVLTVRRVEINNSLCQLYTLIRPLTIKSGKRNQTAPTRKPYLTLSIIVDFQLTPFSIQTTVFDVGIRQNTILQFRIAFRRCRVLLRSEIIQTPLLFMTPLTTGIWPPIPQPITPSTPLTRIKKYEKSNLGNLDLDP